MFTIYLHIIYVMHIILVHSVDEKAITLPILTEKHDSVYGSFSNNDSESNHSDNTMTSTDSLLDDGSAGRSCLHSVHCYTAMHLSYRSTTHDGPQ